MQKICSICNNDFEAKRKDSIYCATKCKKSAEYQRRETYQKKCLSCEKQFETKKKDTEYCSSTCSNVMCKTHDDVELFCKECSKNFAAKYIHRHKMFCSRSCASTYNNKIMYCNDKVRNKISQTKKKQYETGAVVSAFLGKNLSEQHKQKISDTRILNKIAVGENNPSYGKVGEKSAIYGIKRSRETKEIMSNIKAQQWLDGKYNGVDFNKFYKNGFMYSNKCKKEIWYRSGFEKQIFEKLENDENIVTYRVEPFIIKYYYTSQKQNRNYIPDVLCFYKNGDLKLIELKPDYQLEEQKNIDKFSSAQKYCDEKGMTFEVWTEKSNPYLS